MQKARITLAIGASAITGAAIFAADSYFSAAPDGAEPIELAVTDDLNAEAIATECGLRAPDEMLGDGKAAIVADSVTRARVVASGRIDSGEDIAAAIASGDCRYRLDGVWTEEMKLALDRSVVPTDYVSDDGRGGDVDLTHGTYLTPTTLMVDASEDGASLTIRDAFGEGEVLTAAALDETPVNEVFRIRGEVKQYRIAARDGEDGLVEVDVTGQGRMRIRIAGRNFYRPVPTVSDAADLSSVNPFMIGFNLQNLAATRMGYNIYTQNMWKLNDNKVRKEVFARADPSQYAIMEQRTVPVGFKLVPEDYQGTISSKTMIRTEEQYQRSVSWNVGGKVGFGPKDLSGQHKNAVGASYARTDTVGMRSAQATSIMHAIARHKMYSIVLDQPFARLSEAFLEAVEDARRHGRYAQLIEDFGTHYPYAVTYGSAGLAITEFSEETVSNWTAESQNIDANARVAVKQKGTVEMGGGFGEETEQGNTYLKQTSFSDWRAVGGNGAFNAENHATGNTPAPILADLRPLYELLNPLNFPNDPEIYTEVREKLKAAIDDYLAAHSRELSDVAGQMPRKFRLTPKTISCTSEKGWNEKKVELQGNLDFGILADGGRSFAKEIHVANWAKDRGGLLKLDCKSGAAKKLSEYGNTITVEGSMQQLIANTFAYEGPVVEFDAWGKNEKLITDFRGKFSLTDITMPVGGTSEVSFTFEHPKNKNTFTIVTEIERLSTCNANGVEGYTCP